MRNPPKANIITSFSLALIEEQCQGPHIQNRWRITPNLGNFLLGDFCFAGSGVCLSQLEAMMPELMAAEKSGQELIPL